MKKTIRIFAIAMMLCLVFAACGNDYADADASQGLTAEGFFEGITATDYITLCDYSSIPISQSDIDSNLSSICLQYGERTENMTKVTEIGDTINLDFVGSVDGVEFEGGSTQGAGTEIQIGYAGYIPGFEDQLVGHTPGEEFDINVTFPEEYDNEELAGKDAVFHITLNSVIEMTEAELTDEFVATNFESTNGWTTVEDLTDYVKLQLAYNYIFNNSEMSDEEPYAVTNYYREQLRTQYETYAAQYGVDVQTLVAQYGFEDIEAFLDYNASLYYQDTYTAIMTQAIAEQNGFTASDKDVRDYLKDLIGSSNYTELKKNYGMPFLRMGAISYKVDQLLSSRITVE